MGWFTCPCMSAELSPWLCLCSILFPLPTSIRIISVRQNMTGGCVPVHLQIKHNWKKSSFMIWVNFCVYTGPSPGGEDQQWDSIQPKYRGGCWKGDKRRKGENDVVFFVCCCLVCLGFGFFFFHYQFTFRQLVKSGALTNMNSILVACVYQSFFL